MSTRRLKFAVPSLSSIHINVSAKTKSNFDHTRPIVGFEIAIAFYFIEYIEQISQYKAIKRRGDVINRLFDHGSLLSVLIKFYRKTNSKNQSTNQISSKSIDKN